MDNYQVADAFSLLAKLMDIHGENSFRVKTYSIAAFQIEKLDSPLAAMDTASMASLKGIGENTAKKISELLLSGSLSSLTTLINKTPPGILEMMNIKGIGPKKINTIWKEMEIESVGELLYACNENRLTLFKGFGEKTQQNVKESIEYYLSQQGYFLYQQAEDFVVAFYKMIQTSFPESQTFVTGDFRRQLETIETIEFVTDISKNDLKKLFGQQEGMKLDLEEMELLGYSLESGPGVKWHCCAKEKIGEKLFFTTGTDIFIEKFKEFLPFEHSKILVINDEKKIFEQAGMQYIPPYLREDESILGLAKQFGIPELIKPSDIKGIIHSHSKWSDGTHTLLEMASVAKEQGYEYLVISDHSRSAGYANGLTAERIAQQHLEIDQLNKQLAPFKIFKSIESDILIDGSLDYPEEVLASFDLVIASVHSVLKMPEEKAMVRLLKAIENPYTTILGHMTGRLLLSRSGYPINHEAIIDACAAHNVVIELNAHPRRLDMDWRWIPYAISRNVLISIDPDAHATAGFADTKYGVLSAQKGMLTAQNNLSSFGLEAFETFLQSRRKTS